MKRLIILAPAAAFLFGCSGGGGIGGPAAVTLQPGMWETTVQFTTIDMPGAPPEAAQMMRALMGQPQTRSNCITPEQAANPVGRMVDPEGGAAECRFDPNVFAGGTINVRGTCTSPQRGNAQMTMTGTYTATTMEIQLNQQMTAPPNTQGPQSIRLEGRMTARRTGDCPATPATPEGGNSAGGNTTG